MHCTICTVCLVRSYKMVSVGDRVSALATIFDQKNDHTWSQSEFGENWSSARCYGTCQKVFKASLCASVKWDIDNRTTKVACSVLRIENSAGCSTGRFIYMKSVFLCKFCMELLYEVYAILQFVQRDWLI
jgi:hypothetical protein